MSGSLKTVSKLWALSIQRLGFVATAAAGVAVFGTYTKFEAEAQWQHASEAIGIEAGARAAQLQEWLLRADRSLSWFRAEDVSSVDRIALTARMLRTERFVTPAKSLFLTTPSGRLVAGTLPTLDGSASMTAQPWFKAAQAGLAKPGLQVSACTRDPFGSASGVVLYRAVLDRDVVAGYVGSFLPQTAINEIVRDDDPTDGTFDLALRSDTGEAAGCDQAPERPSAHRQQPGLFRSALSRLIRAAPRISQRTFVGHDQAITPGELHLIARSDALDTMSDDQWTALTYRAGYVALSLLLIMALASSVLNRLGRRVRPGLLPHGADAAGTGADWMWELDSLGRLVGLAGNAPDHLLPPSGHSLVEMAGPIGGGDMRWDRLNAAIGARHAFEGLQVPFQIPGRTGLLTIFELSGQPVLASGGFWGTASLISEESVVQPAAPPVPNGQLSAA